MLSVIQSFFVMTLKKDTKPEYEDHYDDRTGIVPYCGN